MAEQITSRLFLGLDTREFRNGIRQADRELKDWSRGIDKIGSMLGAAFAVGVIADFTMEAVKLGDQLEAAGKGFERFGNQADLERLRTATRGMVSDVKLLQQAVSAGNFGIPVKELGNLFEFAQKRAKETGQEVDYLTNSIVTGIGRKSPLILDNLGISASMLRDKLHGVTVESASIALVTKAVGEIASEQLKLMGDTVQDATTSSQQLLATWENFKAESGQIFSPIVNGVLQILQAVINTTKAITGMGEAQKVANGEISGFGIWGIVHQKVSNEVEKTTRAMLNMGETMRGIWTTFNTVGYTTLAGMKSRLAELQKEFENTDISSGKIKTLRQEIEKLQDAINKITNPEKVIPKVEKVNIADKGLKSINATLGETGIVVQQAAETVTTLGDAWEYNAEKLGIFNDLSTELGSILQASFNAALTSGESFFKTFIDGLKKMVAQILATAAAAAALAIALMALGVPGVKGANFGQLFQGLYKNMGGFGADSLNFASFAPGAMSTTGGGAGRTVLRGNDIFVSNSRSGIDISRIGG
jgi:hypothetical protein